MNLKEGCEEISKTSYKATYGSKFFEILSAELRKNLPNAKGFAPQNLRYAEKFYTLYKEIFPQVVGELLMIPWDHHRIIIDKSVISLKNLFKPLYYHDLNAHKKIQNPHHFNNYTQYFFIC